MPRHEVDSVDDVRPRAGALTVEYAHTQQVHILGNTEGLPADDARDVRTVPVAIEAGALAINRVVDSGGTAAEFPVCGENAGVNDIGIHAPAIVQIQR